MEQKNELHRWSLFLLTSSFVVVVVVVVVDVVAVSFLAEICFNYEKLKVVHCNGWWLVSESDPLRRKR